MINGVNRNLALVGGVESMSKIQLGLGQSLSDWIRKFQQARSLGQKVAHVSDLKAGDIRLYIPAVPSAHSPVGESIRTAAALRLAIHLAHRALEF